MELIAVPVRARQLTAGEGVGGHFVVPHRTSGLARGLELDEEVVIVDPDGEFHAATVHDLTFTLDDTHYVLEMGTRLPPQLVRERLAAPSVPVQPEPEDHEVPQEEDLQSLLNLLGELRDRERGPGRGPR